MVPSVNRWSGWLHHSLRWLLRGGLGGLFVAVGISKLMDPAAFAIQIERYGMLHSRWLDPASYALPVIEVIVGGATILGFRWGYIALGGLLLLFTAVIGFALWSGLDIPCGCFSREDVAEQNALWWALGRDLLMLLGVGWLLVFSHKGEDYA